MKKSEIEKRLIDFSIMFLRLTSDYPPDPETDELIDGVLGRGVDSILEYEEAFLEESKFESVRQLIGIMKGLKRAQCNVMLLKDMHPGGREKDWEWLMTEGDEFLTFIMDAIRDRIQSPGPWNEVPREMDEWQ